MLPLLVGSDYGIVPLDDVGLDDVADKPPSNIRVAEAAGGTGIDGWELSGGGGAWFRREDIQRIELVLDNRDTSNIIVHAIAPGLSNLRPSMFATEWQIFKGMTPPN